MLDHISQKASSCVKQILVTLQINLEGLYFIKPDKFRALGHSKENSRKFVETCFKFSYSMYKSESVQDHYSLA